MKAAADMSPCFVFKWRSGRVKELRKALPDGKSIVFWALFCVMQALICAHLEKICASCYTK